MFEYDAGFKATWDTGFDRPVKNPPPRIAPNDCYDKDKWIEGYDEGLTLGKVWRAGRKVGFGGWNDDKNPYDKDSNDWRIRNYYRYWTYGYFNGKKINLIRYLKKVINEHAANLKNYVLIVCHYPDEESYSRGSVEHTRVTKKMVLNGNVDHLMNERWSKDDPFPKNADDLLKYLVASAEGDGMWCNARIRTIQEVKKQKAEAKFKKMEQAAIAFAETCGFKLGTMQFLRALENMVNKIDNAQETWNSGECKAEEYAAHMFAGGGATTYYEDRDFVNGRYDNSRETLREVWQYIERKFPLMMLRYKEKKARKNKDDKTS